MTDNKNRTVAEVRYALSKFGGNLGTEGSVAYLFQQVGLISLSGVEDPDRIMEVAIDSGAEDIEHDEGGSMDIITKPADFLNVRDSLLAQGINPEISDVTMRALNDVSIDIEHAESMLKLLDILEDLDDVQAIHSNAEIPNELLERLN